MNDASKKEVLHLLKEREGELQTLEMAHYRDGSHTMNQNTGHEPCIKCSVFQSSKHEVTRLHRLVLATETVEAKKRRSVRQARTLTKGKP